MKTSPKLWKYIFSALLVLIIVIPLWTLFVAQVIQPDSFILTQEQTMSSKTWPILRWLVILPTLIIALFFSARWFIASRNTAAAEQQKHLTTQKVIQTDQAKREYVLEVIGLGVTLDKYRQGRLWEALQKGGAYASIREQDKEKYPWDSMEKAGISGSRAGDALENGAQYTPMYYGVPVFNAEPPIADPDMADKPNQPLSGLAGSAVSSGMAWHLFVVGPRRFSEHPDRILEDVFAFFDANPDIPYIVLNADDGMYSRNLYRLPNTPELLKDGRYIPEMPDASTLFVLARRERVEAMRPFAFDDMAPEKSVAQLNAHGVARRLFLAYDELESKVPHPDKERDPSMHTSRQPLISEWLPVAAAFAQRSDIRGTGVSNILDGIHPHAYHPPKDWQATPWFPVPWNMHQLAEFDKLPTLGYIHRPTFVTFKDEHGKPLIRRDAREKALQAGWQAALLTLPESQRLSAPARIISATGNNTAQLISLHSMLNNYAAQGGPELDSARTDQFIDTDQRLGNTGAATLFMQMAIGVMGSYRDGGISAAVNLRDGNEASIVFISPPSEQLRKTQKHPRGGDVFAHHGTPAIDPSNYE